jgi:uncharacterized protein YkwD
MLRWLPVVLICAGLLLAGAPQEASARGCRGAHARPTAHNNALMRSALLCLHNRARAAHGIRRLHGHRRLTRAARGHSRRMVRAHFFSHIGPSGARVSQRTRRVGYARRRSFAVAENLGWGTGSHATPRRIFRAWMASSLHRANVLNGRYRSIGIGVAPGAPRAGLGPGGTYTVVYGTR